MKSEHQKMVELLRIEQAFFRAMSEQTRNMRMALSIGNETRMRVEAERMKQKIDKYVTNSLITVQSD